VSDTEKLFAELELPLAELTVTNPVVAPGITIATIEFDEELMGIAFTPPIEIPVELFRLLPIIVTNVPTGPLLGAKEMMLGLGGMKVKPESAVVPSEVVILIAPVAPLPNTAVIEVEDKTWKEATAVPPKVMAVVVFRLVPVIVIVSFVLALEGVKDVIVGADRLG
jgi:hypothetical protein